MNVPEAYFYKYVSKHDLQRVSYLGMHYGYVNKDNILQATHIHGFAEDWFNIELHLEVSDQQKTLDYFLNLLNK